MSTRGPARVWFLLMTIAAGRSNPLRMAAHMPTAAPTASKSEFLWPMTNTRSLSFTWSERVAAMTRVRTLSRFSTPLEVPPKNSKESPLPIRATWSPPRPRAMSRAWRAQRSLSAVSEASLPRPTEMVALMLFLLLLISRTSSSTLKRLCLACSKWDSSVRNRYRLSLSLRIKPPISPVTHRYSTESTSPAIWEFSPPMLSRSSSSRLSKTARPTTGLFLPVLLVNGLEVGVVHKVEQVPLFALGAVDGVLPLPPWDTAAPFSPMTCRKVLGVDVPAGTFSPTKSRSWPRVSAKILVGPHDLPRPAHHRHRQAEFLQGVDLLPGEQPVWRPAGPARRPGGG